MTNWEIIVEVLSKRFAQAGSSPLILKDWTGKNFKLNFTRKG